jgi:hypothetical protein
MNFLSDLPQVVKSSSIDLSGGIVKAVNTSLLRAISATWILSGFITYAQALEWNTKCGITKSSLMNCRQIKGDVFLRGVPGYSHRFVLPDGREFQWFYPQDSENALCRYRNNLMKTPVGNWFEISPRCQDGYIYFQLPSGNDAFVIEMGPY